MANRKVIEIDVEDGSFKKFAAAFAKFSDAVKATVGDMNELDKAQRGAAKSGEKATKTEAMAIVGKRANRKQQVREDEEARKREAAEQKKKDDAERKSELQRKKDRDDAVKSHKELAKWTADVAWNTGKAALNVAKWATIGGLASGFGLGVLASSASGARRQSQGLGIDSGELRAANVNFGKYLDPEGMLGKIADTQSSYGQQFRFGQVGVDPTNKNPADLMVEMLPKLVERFRAVGGKQEGADAMGLTQFATMEELRRLSKLSSDELSKTIDAYREDREKLKVDDSVNRDWQAFMVSIQRAGQTIETSLVKHLGVLAPKLEAFAKSVATGIDTFLSNKDLGKWVDSFANSIGRAAKYLGSEEFQSDVTTFLHAIHSMAKWLAKWFGADDPDAKGGASTASAISTAEYGSSNDDLARMLAQPQGAKSSRVNSLEGQYKLPAGMLDTVWNIESRRGSNNGISSAGAGGDFQIIPGVAAQYGVKDRWNFEQSSDAAARMLRDLLKHYGGDVQKALAGYNWGMGNVDKDIANHGNDWRKYVPRETSNYLAQAAGAKIVIENNTGGNANTTIAALGGG